MINTKLDVKVNDTLYCIKDYMRTHTEFHSGKHYTVVYVADRYVSIKGNTDNIPFSNSSLPAAADGWLLASPLSSYFVTQQQYREQQINTIVNDNSNDDDTRSN